jgi:hypothetical protein
MGLAGMRAPSTSSKPLTMPGAPLVKPIKSPLGGSAAPSLVQPIQPKVVRTPLQPANTLVQPNVTPELEDVPLPASETSDASLATPIPESVVELETAVSEEIAPIEDQLEPTIEPVEAPVVEVAETVEETQDLVESESAVMRPITAVLSPAAEAAPVKTTTLTPVGPQLMPKKARGAPPNISRGAPAPAEDESTAVLTPLRRMTPLKVTKLEKEATDEEVEEN